MIAHGLFAKVAATVVTGLSGRPPTTRCAGWPPTHPFTRLR